MFTFRCSQGRFNRVPAKNHTGVVDGDTLRFRYSLCGFTAIVLLLATVVCGNAVENEPLIQSITWLSFFFFLGVASYFLGLGIGIKFFSLHYKRWSRNDLRRKRGVQAVLLLLYLSTALCLYLFFSTKTEGSTNLEELVILAAQLVMMGFPPLCCLFGINDIKSSPKKYLESNLPSEVEDILRA